MVAFNQLAKKSSLHRPWFPSIILWLYYFTYNHSCLIKHKMFDNAFDFKLYCWRILRGYVNFFSCPIHELGKSCSVHELGTQISVQFIKWAKKTNSVSFLCIYQVWIIHKMFAIKHWHFQCPYILQVYHLNYKMNKFVIDLISHYLRRTSGSCIGRFSRCCPFCHFVTTRFL